MLLTGVSSGGESVVAPEFQVYSVWTSLGSVIFVETDDRVVNIANGGGSLTVET